MDYLYAVVVFILCAASLVVSIYLQDSDEKTVTKKQQ